MQEALVAKVSNKNKDSKISDYGMLQRFLEICFQFWLHRTRNPNSKFTSSVIRCSLEVNGKQLLYGTRRQHGTLYKAAIKPILPERIAEVNTVAEDISTLQLYHER